MSNAWKLRAAAFAVVATMAVPVVGMANPAGAAAGGNSANAHACQKGGWQNWVRADQTPFANQDECVSYAAHGGTLTVPNPLPDLVPDGSCTPTATTVECTFRVRNDGAPFTGTFVIRAEISWTTGQHGGLSAEASVDPACSSGDGASDFTGNGIFAEATCGATLLHGQTLELSAVGAGGSDAPVAVNVTVDPGNTIVESNETNNTYSQTFNLGPDS